MQSTKKMGNMQSAEDDVQFSMRSNIASFLARTRVRLTDKCLCTGVRQTGNETHVFEPDTSPISRRN